MQFSETFASTCAVTIPVLALAVVVEHRPPAGRHSEAQRAARWWYVIQVWNLIAELVCLYVLISPTRLQRPGEIQDAALVVVGGSILASMALIILQRPKLTEE